MWLVIKSFVAIFSLFRFIPRYGKLMASLIDGKIKTHKIYQMIIDEHRARPEKTDTFLAAFDNIMSTNNSEYFTQLQFHHLLADLFGAGTDTTFTTFRWFLLFMAAYPDEQVRFTISIFLRTRYLKTFKIVKKVF